VRKSCSLGLLLFLVRMLWKGVRPILFRMDAERAHRIGVKVLQWAIRLRPKRGGKKLSVSGCSADRADEKSNISNRFEPSPVLFGMKFRSRVGLAAGFDKNAEVLTALPILGFGFGEIGTVTPRPQPGNPRPRLFRDSSQKALFNRMGFNNDGAFVISRRLERMRGQLPDGFRVGVNLGKNKDTPLERAWTDYVEAARPFRSLADYLVINISSPNTPGLRSLQTGQSLKPILEGVRNLTSAWHSMPPLLVKIAPELSGSELSDFIHEVEPWGVDGWILTNTLAGTYQPSDLRSRDLSLEGGWSGGPLAPFAMRSLNEARKGDG
jgi:dihydroorotate dehydrogenase